MQCKILDRVAGFLIFVSEIPADASAFFGPAPDRTALMASGAEFRISTWCARSPYFVFRAFENSDRSRPLLSVRESGWGAGFAARSAAGCGVEGPDEQIARSEACPLLFQLP